MFANPKVNFWSFFCNTSTVDFGLLYVYPLAECYTLFRFQWSLGLLYWRQRKAIQNLKGLLSQFPTFVTSSGAKVRMLWVREMLTLHNRRAGNDTYLGHLPIPMSVRKPLTMETTLAVNRLETFCFRVLLPYPHTVRQCEHTPSHIPTELC